MALCRRLLVALFGLSVALWASPALAQTGGTGGTSGVNLTTGDFKLTLQQQNPDLSYSDLSQIDVATYLNHARCQCATPVQIVVQMLPASVSKLSTTTQLGTQLGTQARLYVGTDCANKNSTDTGPQCPDSQMLGEINGITTLSQGPWQVPTTADKLFAPYGGCNPTQASAMVWLWLDTTGTARPDPGVTGGSAPSLNVPLVGTPPAAPNGITVEGGDEALVVSWALLSTSTYPNLAGYLVFCMRGDGLQVFDPSYYTSQYQTSQILCPPGTPTTATATATAAGKTTAVEVPAPAIFQNLDKKYLCSDLLPYTQASARIRILQNGIPYTVGVAAVDTSGNASPIASGFVQKPVPTINLYQAYRDAGGQSPGGYCALAGRDARLGAIAFLASAGFLGLLIFRRRRRARRALSRGLPWLLVTLAAGSAQAQQVASHAQTEEKSAAQSGDYRTPREWAIELRFGPYAPDVDSEFSGGATPYKTMFGSKRHLMSQLEFDWQFFQAFGSLGVGAVVGYYNESAKAFTADATGQCVTDSTGACTRSADATSLRLIPVAALLVYRWDVAAEHWKIPLVPYAKLGLNYTFWEINNGNGNVPEYKGGHGSGGTAGWQAAAGMSLLLDILDPDASRGLDMETGVNHSYVFFEWNRVDASGLGMSKKLHVGDSRWVLGLMFEF